jgi:uncharacterized FlaG/YvyC family protein
MKTDQINPTQNYQHQIKEKHGQEQANKEMVKDRNNQSYIIEKSEHDKKDTQESIQKITQLESVKKHIQENIQWKRMKFRRHEENNRIYIDIIDRKTNEVIKTIPETDFVKLSQQASQNNPGLTINISG